MKACAWDPYRWEAGCRQCSCILAGDGDAVSLAVPSAALALPDGDHIDDDDGDDDHDGEDDGEDQEGRCGGGQMGRRMMGDPRREWLGLLVHLDPLPPPSRSFPCSSSLHHQQQLEIIIISLLVHIDLQTD